MQFSVNFNFQLQLQLYLNLKILQEIHWDWPAVSEAIRGRPGYIQVIFSGTFIILPILRDPGAGLSEWDDFPFVLPLDLGG